MTERLPQSEVTLLINGTSHVVSPWAGTSLLGYLRDDLGMTGTKVGCSSGACGACTVLLDGIAVQSCQLALSSLNDARVQTIDGVLQSDIGMSVAQALIEARAAQCGYCLPGIVVAACAAIERNGPKTDFADALARNLCRCGTHTRILTALQRLGSDLNEDNK